MSEIFKIYIRTNLLLRILIALVLGLICGLIFPNQQGISMALDIFSTLGDIFIRLLKMLVMPVVSCSLIVGMASILPSNIGKIGIKIIAFYTLTSICAIIIGLGISALLATGANVDLQIHEAPSPNPQMPNLLSVLLSLIPTNPFNTIAHQEVLPSVFFCAIFGIALAFCKNSKDASIKEASGLVFKFFEGISAVIFKIVGWVMQYAPIGVFSLIFVVFAKNGKEAFGTLADMTMTVYAGFIAQIAIVYFGICLFLKLNPIKFIKKVRLPMLTAFITRSSATSIPISIQTAQERMGISRHLSSFTLPLGATINMDGTTICLGVCVTFIANLAGIELNASAYISIILTSLLASIGTAGVPGAGAIMLIMVLESIGLKVEANSTIAVAYGMILGIDALLDMGRTSMNVTGDIMGTLAIAKSQNSIDMSKWSDENERVLKQAQA
ncbi:dicarboxylate/amino acid:cation symporter [Campylobacter sp. 19-13652]|uniref:dicarboxylate/amino acid:cation symporter n=1 Tax=Campylobacter sp. 19-13652 TaxID=2840180 RepID=UPI001C76878C|nr:dicarboxylate/amino acid:cation symporter [Campylobacter sp. 19-13652]BCX78965.1 amino acid transporter [Campylobacter sp. 19-13652]